VYSDARPYVAHWAQTLHFLQRRDDAAWFFNPATGEPQRDEFLDAHDIQVVISGPAEASIGGSASPPAFALVRVVSGETSVYVTSPAQARR
jgi:hypothetical protein